MKFTGLQTTDYVPGISGMRLDFKTGAIEINKPGPISEPQMLDEGSGEVFITEELLERSAIDAVGAGLRLSPLELPDLAELIRQVVREELKPGGLLHRR